MQLVITSASGNILSAERFERVVVMTEDGEITILPNHEPLLSALRPGILHVEYFIGEKTHTADYATGGGVLNISPDVCTLVADVVENADRLTDLEYIAAQKQEAEALMRSFREENGPAVDPKRLIEIEYELLKYTAMHHLGKMHQDMGGTGRK